MLQKITHNVEIKKITNREVNATANGSKCLKKIPIFEILSSFEQIIFTQHIRFIFNSYFQIKSTIVFGIKPLHIPEHKEKLYYRQASSHGIKPYCN